MLLDIVVTRAVTPRAAGGERRERARGSLYIARVVLFR